MKKKIFRILILIIIIVIIVTTISVIRHIKYNNIEENWILKISPNYLNSPPNSVYLYEDSYIITNCFTVNSWQNIVYKRGKLTSKLDEKLILQIKNETSKELENEKIQLSFLVTLSNGENLTLASDSDALNTIINLIDYKGTIWYAQQY